MSKAIVVDIVGDHPHAGCRGHINGDSIGLFGTVMFKVTLDMPNPTMTDACYAERKNIRAVTTKRAAAGRRGKGK